MSTSIMKDAPLREVRYGRFPLLELPVDYIGMRVKKVDYFRRDFTSAALPLMGKEFYAMRTCYIYRHIVDCCCAWSKAMLTSAYEFPHYLVLR